MWTLDELVDRVGQALAAEYSGAPNGRVRDVPDRRAIRWYKTIGLIDRPVGMSGRTALYGPRHLLQLVAIKRRQADGLTIAQIQAELTGAGDDLLAGIARVPAGLLAVEGPHPGVTEVGRPRFWAAPAAGADDPEAPADLALRPVNVDFSAPPPSIDARPSERPAAAPSTETKDPAMAAVLRRVAGVAGVAEAPAPPTRGEGSDVGSDRTDPSTRSRAADVVADPLAAPARDPAAGVVADPAPARGRAADVVADPVAAPARGRAADVVATPARGRAAAVASDGDSVIGAVRLGGGVILVLPGVPNPADLAAISAAAAPLLDVLADRGLLKITEDGRPS